MTSILCINESDGKPRIAVVAFPWQSPAPYKSLSDLAVLLAPLSKEVTFITGMTNRIRIHSDNIHMRDIGVVLHYTNEDANVIASTWSWLAKCLIAQVRTSAELAKLRGKNDIVIFYTAYPYYLPSLIMSKILGMKTLEIVTRSQPTTRIERILSFQDGVLFRLLDGISPESKSLISALNLGKFSKKLTAMGARFIDVAKFKPLAPVAERGMSVGFIGRLSPEKGIVELIEAMRIVLSDERSIRFVVAGSGPLSKWVENQMSRLSSEHPGQVEFMGYVDEDKLPGLYNEMRLFVLPSKHSEGLPTTILEAMACGTPVLVAPKGGIPDIVQENKTGFLLEETGPAKIAATIIRLLEDDGLRAISQNSACLVASEYSLSGAIKRYHEIIAKVLNPPHQRGSQES